MKINEQEQKEKQSMAVEVGKILPETIEKIDHYTESLIAEGNLLNALEKRQSSLLVLPMTKLREANEIIKLKNSILSKQKTFDSYFARRRRYEDWMDEMMIEVNAKFDEVLAEAKGYHQNLRLSDAIEKFEEIDRELSAKERIDFYLYLRQELLNKSKHKK